MGIKAAGTYSGSMFMKELYDEDRCLVRENLLLLVYFARSPWYVRRLAADLQSVHVF